jgi:hypothetical protein
MFDCSRHSYFVFNVLFGGLVLTARNAAISAIMYLSTFNFGFQVGFLSL